MVEDGNRLIQFRYDGIFEEILDELGQMPLPPYITHELKDKTVIRLYMPNMKDLQPHLLQACISQKNC